MARKKLSFSALSLNFPKVPAVRSGLVVKPDIYVTVIPGCMLVLKSLFPSSLETLQLSDIIAHLALKT